MKNNRPSKANSDHEEQQNSAQDVLIRAAEKTGHPNPQSLQSYLALAAKKNNHIELLRDLDGRENNKASDLNDTIKNG